MGYLTHATKLTKWPRRYPSVILSLGALRRGVFHGRRDDGDGRRCGGYRGYSVAEFGMAFFSCALETGTILNRMIWVSTIHAEFVSDAALSFFLR